MALLDIFKKKKAKDKKEKKAKEKKPSVIEAASQEKLEQEPGGQKLKPESKTEKPKSASSRVTQKEFSLTAFRILRSPHITEKSVALEAEGKYVFKVTPEATKPEIKKAIEELYGIKVLDVNVVNIPPKKRRLGRSEGYKKGYKKAIVTVGREEKIDMGI